MQYVIETSGLTKRFGGRVAVDGVSLQVPSGCAYGYLGPNGAGKTTLIRLLLGLTRASAGTIRLFGQPVPAKRASVLGQVGALVQSAGFHGHLTGRENLRIAAAAREPSAFGRIDGALRQVGLAERADDRVSTYSQGGRRRLGLARCLLTDPALLILDEPANGLDPAGTYELRQMIRRLVAEGRTVLLSSHLLDEVERTCDAVAMVDRGRIIAQGLVAELAAALPQTIRLCCIDEMRALGLLSTHPVVDSAVGTPEGILITLRHGTKAAEAASEVNRRLLEAGIAVQGLEVRRVSLEEHFLQLLERNSRNSRNSSEQTVAA
jgi:ABC-2 type transport system ATP-binding protein